MPDVPVFHVRPPLRCCAADLDRPYGVCGAPAAWERSPGAGQVSSFYCAVHRGESDKPVAGEVFMRRVCLVVEVVYSATIPAPGRAQREALAELEAAVQGSGGSLSLVSATSQVGRFVPPAPARQPVAGGERV